VPTIKAVNIQRSFVSWKFCKVLIFKVLYKFYSKNKSNKNNMLYFYATKPYLIKVYKVLIT